MKMTFRWFGEDDKVTLDEIRQIPVIDGIVTALPHPRRSVEEKTS